MSNPPLEDRTTPQRRPIPPTPAPPSEPSPEPLPPVRDKTVLRPVLGGAHDATVVMPRDGAHDATVVMPRDDAPDALRQRPGPGAALAMALKPGVRLHEYRIDGVLGDGGFGITYLATDVHLNAAVAIKEYIPQDIAFRAADGTVSPTASEHRARYRQGLDSFLVEARTLAAFRHRAIVRVARFFEAHGTAYMVLEVEKGSPLKAWWPHRRQIGEKALVELLLPLLDGLAAVHKAGFLHRDIKPDNIQVRAGDGSFVLLDFGSAGQTAAVATHGMVVVTPGYAPIEQYGLGEQGPWTDLYALGATLYWAVSGHKPPDAETRKADPKAYRRAVDAGRDVYGDAFLKAIDWALNTDPAKRPRTVAEFRHRLCADHPASLQRFEAARRRTTLARSTPDGAPSGTPAPAADPRRAAARPRWTALLRPRDWPLALKLALAMGAAAVLPMVAVALATLRGSEAALVAAEARHLQQLATHIAADVSAFIADGRRLTRALAADPALAAWLQKPAEPARAALRDKLQRLAQADAGVQGVTLLDTAGTVQVATDARAQGGSQALRPWFQAARGGQPYTSGLVAGATAGAASLVSAEPVRGDNGAVVGVLVLRTAADAVGRAMARAQPAAHLTPFLVDADGVLVHHPLADLRHRSLMPLPPETLAQIRADQRFRRNTISSLGEAALARALTAAQAPGSLSYVSALSAQTLVAGYAPVPGHDWVVAVSAGQAAVLRPLLHLQGWLLAGALGVAALIAAVAWGLARRLARPIRAVTQGLGELQAGDYEDARVRIDRGDEIGQLGRAFNALGDQLRQRQRDQERERAGGGADGVG